MTAEAQRRVTFEYIKSQFFRVIHADGAIGGITPRGLIHAAFFTERPAIPRKTTFVLSDTMKPGDEIESERVSREGFIREMDIDVMMTIDVAEALAKWLNERILEVKELKRKERGE